MKISHFSGANELTFHHILCTEIAQQQEHLAQKLQSRREKRMQELIEEQEKQREELLTSSDGDTNTSKSMEVSWYINSFDAGDGIFWLLWGNTMPADALAPKVTRASTDMVLAV